MAKKKAEENKTEAQASADVTAEVAEEVVPDEKPAQKVSPGRIVMYKSATDKLLPAIVQEVISESRVDLNIQLKGSVGLKSNVVYSSNGAVGTWDYPAKV